MKQKYKINYSPSFQRDFRKAKSLNRETLKKLNSIIILLETQGSLPPGYKSHRLKGKQQKYWECHLESNLLLTYTVNKEDGIITLEHLGNHDDLYINIGSRKKYE